MSSRHYIGPSLVKVALLPARASYLIRAGSRVGLRRAVQEASTRWGGMTEPIIPVRRNGSVDSWWRHVVETAGVEGLVDVDAGADLAQKAARSLSLPVVPLKHIDRAGSTKWTLHPEALPMHGDPTQAPVIACSNGRLWQAVAAGDFSPSQERDAHSEHVRFRRPTTADQIARASLRGETFLDRTVESFDENYAENSWPIPAIVWVTANDSYRDCLWFWNFRALRSLRFEPSPMVIVPLNDVRNWLNFSRDLAFHLARPDEFAPDVSVMSITASHEGLHSLATETLGLQITEDKLRTGHKMPTQIRTAPFTYRLNLELRHLLTFVRRYGEDLELEAHPAEGTVLLRFSSPVQFSGGGYTLLRLTSSLFDPFPRKDALAKRIVNNGVWRGDSVQIATNAMNDYRLEIAVPPLDEAVHALIAERTTEHELSEKGRLAAVLIADSDLAVLLRPSVYESIVHLTTPRARAYRREMEAMRTGGMSEAEVQAFGARWGGRGERRYDCAAGLITRLGKKAVAPVDALETLCGLGWAERGVETHCDRCGLRSFVPISVIDKGAICPGCRASASHTADEHGVTIQYRLNTFIDRASDQGVMPHLLVIAALTRQSEWTNLLGGTLVRFHDGVTNEVDILGVHDRQFLAGEVKSKAIDFTQQQLERDIALSARLGADIHLIAAVDELPSSIVQAAHSLGESANVRILALSANQLRPNHT